jgi:uncharacterized RDD family membrane protein YckC
MAHHGPDLVTGDAVVVELRLAKLPSRTLAFLIDVTIQVIALFALTFLLGAMATATDDVLAFVFVFVGSIAVLVGYPAAMETLTRGRTVGKLAVGLRVVRGDGGAIRFRHALVRALSAVVEIYLCFGAVAVITSLLSPEGKRVGDYLAGTVVVRERSPSAPTPAPWIPSSLRPWAETLDLRQLQASTALQVRQFLGRAHSLNAGARTSLAQSLADEVARQVSPLPPPGVSAEMYLGIVLAERSRRAQEGAAETTARPGAQEPPSLSPTVDAAPAAPDGAAEPGDFTAPT